MGQNHVLKFIDQRDQLETDQIKKQAADQQTDPKLIDKE